jgi:hypothetical protein
MIVRCMTCQHLIIGAPSRIVGCLCDPDASTWVAVADDQRIIGGTYKYFIPLSEAPNE